MTKEDGFRIYFDAPKAGTFTEEEMAEMFGHVISSAVTATRDATIEHAADMLNEKGMPEAAAVLRKWGSEMELVRESKVSVAGRAWPEGLQ